MTDLKYAIWIIFDLKVDEILKETYMDIWRTCDTEHNQELQPLRFKAPIPCE